jgi:uncharacterized protein YyaL (SSP411 family)
MSNRLAGASSPYLLQHANNPVNWFPWGDEAFERARDENKLIFLSIGYSTCHWCHVMERESFENIGIASLLNEHFINIKVDREERPDVDRVYMSFVQATTGGGGWPMNVWLTPNLEPVVGGTYFPPDERYGRPGFPVVIKRIAEAWQSDGERMTERGREVVEALRAAAHAPDAKVDLASAVAIAVQQFLAAYDPDHGGLGGAPKFPRTTPYDLLLRAGQSSEQAQIVVVESLRKIAAGGIHDHLGGGFHRYSVDERWHVPHFEKMLYDQAQLAMLYIDALRLTGDPAFADAARGIFEYVLRDMTSPSGGFYSAEDADSHATLGAAEKTEGAFYVWSRSEVETLLGEDAALFCDAYGVESNGNVSAQSDPHGELTGLNVLFKRLTDEALAHAHGLAPDDVRDHLHRARATLFATRTKRPRPHLDDKVIAGWNGLMISALARGGAVLGESTFVEAARSAAAFVREHLTRPDTGELLRSWREGVVSGDAFAEDYAYLIQAALDLYEADADANWLHWAVQMQEIMDRRFWDANAGGYFNSADGQADVLVRMKEDYDGAEPGASSVAAMNLARLSQILDDATFRDRAELTIRAFSGQLDRMPTALPLLLCAWLQISRPGPEIILTSDPDSEIAQTARHVWVPGRVIIYTASAENLPASDDRRAFLLSLSAGNSPRAYVCRNQTCELPVENSGDLKRKLLE